MIEAGVLPVEHIPTALMAVVAGLIALILMQVFFTED